MLKGTEGKTLPRRAYRVNEICKTYGASRSWVYLRIADGSLPSVRVAGARFIRAEDAEKFFGGKHAA